MVSNIVAAFILAVVQGITEWLPISSSGHLLLAENILGYDGGLLLQVALHFGTLMAIFVYFGKEIIDVLQDFLKGNWKSPDGKMAWLIIVATLPAGIAGIFLARIFDSYLSTMGLLVVGFAITGVFLMISSFYSINKPGKPLGFMGAFLIGIAQAVAIVPGISRAGSTIATGLILGMKEKDAMKFSFMMAIPIVFGANILVIGNQKMNSELIWATLVCFIVALGVIHWMYKYVLARKENMKWFGLYCLLLAMALGLWIVFS